MGRTTWIATAALLALTACGGGATSPDGSGAPVGDVTVGNDFFRSARNGTRNPAVDTVAAGSTITWAWNASGSHSIRSTGTLAFRSSAVQAGAGDTYSVRLDAPGTYTYDCSIHGSVMTGRIVVQ